MIATIGTFDGVHIGHTYLIQKMADYAHSIETESAVVTFTSHPLTLIKSINHPYLITPTKDKLSLLKETATDKIIPLEFDEELRRTSAMDFLRFLKNEYNIDTIAIGHNNSIGADVRHFDDEFISDAVKDGFSFVRFPQSKDKVSSTKIRERLNEGDISTANYMLGRKYSIEGMVVHGKGIGHKIGFPTANINPIESHQIVPAVGVYACVITIDGIKQKAVVNIGHRPTIEKNCNAPLTIEAHIIANSKNLYGEVLKLEFISRIRDEQHFDSVEKLKSRISQDIQIATNQ